MTLSSIHTGNWVIDVSAHAGRFSNTLTPARERTRERLAPAHSGTPSPWQSSGQLPSVFNGSIHRAHQDRRRRDVLKSSNLPRALVDILSRPQGYIPP